MLRVGVCLRNALAGPLQRGDRGATAVEYGLIVTFIAIVIVTAVTLVGNRLVTAFTNVANQL